MKVLPLITHVTTPVRGIRFASEQKPVTPEKRPERKISHTDLAHPGALSARRLACALGSMYAGGILASVAGASGAPLLLIAFGAMAGGYLIARSNELHELKKSQNKPTEASEK